MKTLHAETLAVANPQHALALDLTRFVQAEAAGAPAGIRGGALTLGDVMLDRFIYRRLDRISPRMDQAVGAELVAAAGGGYFSRI